MSNATHLSAEQLEAGLEHLLAAPKQQGVLQLIVRRPGVEQREVISEGSLSLEEGLVGDNWSRQPTPDRETQLTLMNSRVIELIAPDESRWPLAGDQLFVDFDLGKANLPTGTRLSIGDAVVEVTAPDHTGCKKFVARFGMPAMLFTNSEQGRQHNLRGINAKVVQPGAIRQGDAVTKVIG